MKTLGFAFILSAIIMLALVGCGGEDYDPSASKTDGSKVQGKVIEGSSEKESLAGPIEGISGESTGSLQINTLAGSGSENETEQNNLAGPVEAKEKKVDEGEDVTKVIEPTDSLVGQNLPEVQPSQDSLGSDTVASPTPEAPKSNLPPLPKGSPYKEISFRALSSFAYDVEWETDGKEPDPTAFIKRVPAEVRKLSGTKVAVEGFMIPTMVNEDNKVTEFLLLPDQMSCCYGKNPAANGWVVVRSKGIDIMMEQIIRVTGSMFVEERWDEEFFEGLYHLDCEKVTGPAL